MIKFLCLAAGIFFLVGCTMFHPGPRPATPVKLPGNYTPDNSFALYNVSDPGPGKWWQAFDSDELNSLVGQALSDNFDIQTAMAKLDQARAEAKKAGADLSPILDLDLGARNTRTRIKNNTGSSSSTDVNTFSAGVSAGYELDLWGRLSALHSAELLTYEASGEDLEAAAVTVAADVTTAWVDILSYRRQIAILDNQIRMNENMLSLQELRFLNGQADTLAVSQQREALAEARALLPALQKEEELMGSALAVLLGQAGTGNLNISQADLPGLIPLPKTGLPADLLASRPDVRAAGLRLNSADWQVSAARADRLPSLSLSASPAFSANALDLLFSNWTSTLAAALTGPLFDGGTRKAEEDRTRAEADLYLTAYAQTVAQAVAEVEESLIIENRQTQYLELLKEQLVATRLTVKDARIQYINGQDNYLDYLTAWTKAQSLERQLISEQADLIKNRVTLYRVLGGNWTRDLIPADRNNLNKNGV